MSSSSSSSDNFTLVLFRFNLLEVALFPLFDADCSALRAVKTLPPLFARCSDSDLSPASKKEVVMDPISGVEETSASESATTWTDRVPPGTKEETSDARAKES